MATIKNYVDEYKKTYGGDYEKQVADKNAIYDNQIAALKASSAGVLNDANAKYDELERQNEIAKYINAEKVAENNANLGLTKSGLNLTQQTAVQLSAANNAASIARQRQSMVDSLARDLTASEAQINANRATDLLNLEQTFNEKAENYGLNKYKIEADAETERLNNQLKAQATQKENNLKSFGSMIKSAIQKGDYASALQYYTTAGNMLDLDPYSGLTFLSDYAKLSEEDIDQLLGSANTPVTSTANYQNLNYSDLGTVPIDILLDPQNWSLSSSGGSRGWFTGLDRNATAKFKLDNGKTYRMDEILWFLQNGINKLGAADAKAKIIQFQQDIGATKKIAEV